jgi:hypothetical protein
MGGTDDPPPRDLHGPFVERDTNAVDNEDSLPFSGVLTEAQSGHSDSPAALVKGLHLREGAGPTLTRTQTTETSDQL